MEKDELIKLEEINQRSKSNSKRLDEHEIKIEKLENVYIALTEMNGRVGKVENDVSEIKTIIKDNDPKKAKAIKWDKLIEYIFYSILAFALFKLELK